MASLWEIADPSNLLYNTTLGRTSSDSGQGPITGANGWIRTGFIDDTTSTTGHANCDGWTSFNPSHEGTAARLPDTWTVTGDIGVWVTETPFCGISYLPVWCVED